MKIKHLLVWVPVIGIYCGLKWGHEPESPIRSFFFETALIQAVSIVLLIVSIAIFASK